jgi:D-alanyl-D-alanine carboxypeptidase (penicillin-binding protein 5/6)
VPADPAPLLIPKSLQSKVTTKVEVAEQVNAPVEAGQRLGTMTMQADGEPLASIPLVAPEAVERKTWWDLFVELLQTICFRG